MKVESVIADTPSNGTLLVGGSALVGLTFDAKVHDVVSTDSTVVNDNIPRPKSNSIPLLHFESFLAIACTF